MPDRLDAWLSEMSSPPMPADLGARVRARLRGQRAREAWRRRAGDAALLVASLTGAVALWPQARAITAWDSVGALDASANWLANLAAAPAPAVWQTARSALDGAAGIAADLGPAGLLGSILLAVSLSAWLLRLLPRLEDAGATGISIQGAGT